MALTHDEKKEILEWRGKQYSLVKTADKTGHSETTVRKVIREAETQVSRLRAKGLGAKEIASDLDIPFPFVSNTIDKWDIHLKELEQLTNQTAEPKTFADFSERWDQFRKVQDLESAKKSLRQRVQQRLVNLQRLEQRLDGEGIADTDWHQRKELLEHQLADFVLQQVDNIDSQEALENLEEIAKEIEDQIGIFRVKYTAKLSKAKKLRLRQEKEQSNQLLEEKLKTLQTSTSVREQIKSIVLVKNETEASVIYEAMLQFAMENKIIDKLDNKELADKTWRIFTENIKEQRWGYLKNLANKFKSECDRTLLEIHVCPRCDVKLLPQLVAGKEVLHCPICGVSYPKMPSG